MGRALDLQLKFLFRLKRLAGSEYTDDSPLNPRPARVVRSASKATVHLSAGSLGAARLERDLHSDAQRLGLHYSSEIGRGVLLRSLTITVHGSDSAIDSFINRANSDLRDPVTGP